MTATPITPEMIAEKNRLRQKSPFVFLYSIPLDDEVLRVCSYTEELTVSRNGEDLEFKAAPVKMRGLGLDSEGRAASARAVVADVGRQLEPILEEYDGLTDRPVDIEITNVNLLHQVGVQFRVWVTSQVTNEEGSAFRLGGPPGLRGSTQRFFNGHRCTHRLGGPLCGWNLLFPGAAQTCSHFLLGPNGCAAKARYQQRTGQTVELPGAIGMQPGITGSRRR